MHSWLSCSITNGRRLDLPAFESFIDVIIDTIFAKLILMGCLNEPRNLRNIIVRTLLSLNKLFSLWIALCLHLNSVKITHAHILRLQRDYTYRVDTLKHLHWLFGPPNILIIISRALLLMLLKLMMRLYWSRKVNLTSSSRIQPCCGASLKSWVYVSISSWQGLWGKGRERTW